MEVSISLLNDLELYSSYYRLHRLALPISQLIGRRKGRPDQTLHSRRPKSNHPIILYMIEIKMANLYWSLSKNRLAIGAPSQFQSALNI